MQTIIKELSLNPTIQELMFNADITQISNQTWFQILCSGTIGAIIGGLISGGITFWAMSIIDNFAKKRWEKSFFKQEECKFWLNFYKEFHIANRFFKTFLNDIIFYDKKQPYERYACYSEDQNKNIFEEWYKHFEKLHELVNGYEDLYLTANKIDKTHISIILAMYLLLQEYLKKDKLKFDKNLMLDDDLYADLYKSFNFYFWENAFINNLDRETEIAKLCDSKTKEFNNYKLWQFFENKLDYIEKQVKIYVNSNL